MARGVVSGGRPGLAWRAWILVLAALVLAAGAWLHWGGSGRVPARAEVRIGRVAEALVLDRWQAMRLAVEAGRDAFLAGRIPRKRYASASSPIDGLIG